MSTITDLVICNMAMNRMGLNGTITTIAPPDSKVEKVFSLWYDSTRRECIQLVLPNFAITRENLALIPSETSPFGYSYSFMYPADVLQILGIGNVEEKQNNYKIESTANGKRIYTDENPTDGLPVRYARDVTDESKFSAEFVPFMSWVLAYNTMGAITNDLQKHQAIEAKYSKLVLNATSINSHENRPVRINRSKFKAAKYSSNPKWSSKK